MTHSIVVRFTLMLEGRSLLLKALKSVKVRTRHLFFVFADLFLDFYLIVIVNGALVATRAIRIVLIQAAYATWRSVATTVYLRHFISMSGTVIESVLKASFDFSSLLVVLFQFLFPLSLLFHILHFLPLLGLFELLGILFLFPIEFFLFVFLHLQLLFVLLGRFDAEILNALVLRQLVIVNLHPLGLALIVSILGLLSCGLWDGIVIGIDTEDLLK